MSVHNDLVLGARLAVGGGRTRGTSLVRLALVATGVGLAVAALLLALSAVGAVQARMDRESAREPVPAEAGDTSTYVIQDWTYYRGTLIEGAFLQAGGAGAPVPPGLDRVPAPGELVVSPALAELLRSPEGELLRPRFTGRVVGTISAEGLADAGELRYYAGADGLRESGAAEAVGAFGERGGSTGPPPFLMFLLGVSAAVVFVPLLIFVSSVSRIAGAERDRRLSALRLAGADAAQLRRIAAAEALVGALAGVAVGAVVFLAARPAVAGTDIAGIPVRPADFAPSWQAATAGLLLAPVLAVGSALFGLRHLVVEPLGVVRRSAPVRRRLWWRLSLVGAGVLALSPDLVFAVEGRGHNTAVAAGTGSVLLLLGVPALTAWLTDRLVRRLRGGTPAWQLAVRRLQLDSGTPTRVVAGVTAVLAGAIALHGLFGAVQAERERVIADERDAVLVAVTDADFRHAAELLRHTQGVREVDDDAIVLDETDPAALERARNALAPLSWRASLSAPVDSQASAERAVAILRGVLVAGVLLTLVISGASLLVLVSGQLAERRRALAALGANGVPWGVVGRSLLWQNAIPIGVGVVVAVSVGLAATALVGRLLEMPFRPDWPIVAGLAAVAVLVVLAATAALLPAVRAATTQSALRAE
ncbi:FtsX-like permease family protein [Prauserella shujinwangii]|uniref:FtsX-like permease family protein n=1 Tax=Prauserella shujinwangii TaxID=1453103 RepID=A0A2T0LQ65_9PSEU|nr:FtsX-like permease family protein [Prauserella shujinwangii]PRX45496.1 FtsX-like permease family protein [Prauserella shujinwangii]